MPPMVLPGREGQPGLADDLHPHVKRVVRVLPFGQRQAGPRVLSVGHGLLLIKALRLPRIRPKKHRVKAATASLFFSRRSGPWTRAQACWDAQADTVTPSGSSARGRRRVREGDVELRYHGGPLAYRTANPLDGPRSHIADGEHAQEVRLQWQWPLLVIVRSRQNESLCVQSDPAAAQPLRRRIRAYEEKDIADRQLRLFTGGHAPPAYTLQMRSRRAAQRDELRPRQHFDLGGGRDAVDEVARHGRGEPVPTQQDRHAPGVSRQEHRGLAGRID